MSKSIDPVDRLVGVNIRALRIAKKMSQSELGQEIGVSFQQVQKYEKGRNRVGAGRLQNIARVLGVTPEALFSGASQESATDDEGPMCLLSNAHAVRLLLAFSKIGDRRLQHSIVELVEHVSADATLAGVHR
jgi:transcriptional regulator with XRE-family HTH domain